MAIHSNCHMIGVVGGKGGCGKSVFAANLAAAFALELRAKTLLIDLDQNSAGDQNVISGLRPQKPFRPLQLYRLDDSTSFGAIPSVPQGWFPLFSGGSFP